KWAFGLSLLVLGGISLSAWAGADSSGGASHLTDEDNPWFLGSAPIPYCVHIAPDFPVARSVVERDIADAFAQWKAVYAEYHLYQRPLPGRFADGVPRSLSVDAREIPQCTDPAHELEFKVGVVDSDVQTYFASHSKTAIGYAFRKDYDHQTFRTGGYVWV